jgi:hypothetical protein
VYYEQMLYMPRRENLSLLYRPDFLPLGYGGQWLVTFTITYIRRYDPTLI